LADWSKSSSSGTDVFVYDHTLRDEYGSLYDSQGRWLLTASVFIGWARGMTAPLSERVIGFMVGFVSGSVTINSIRDELPRSGEGRFTPFEMGAAVFSMLLLL
jgi:hypothetical protein